MDKKDFNNYRNSVIEGCIENIFDEDYIYYFLKINEIQPEGKRRMAVADYLRGCKMGCGEVLGMTE